MTFRVGDLGRGQRRAKEECNPHYNPITANYAPNNILILWEYLSIAVFVMTGSQVRILFAHQKLQYTTSLSTSSLLRADANFPLQSFASLATTAEATSKTFHAIVCGDDPYEADSIIRFPSSAVVDQSRRRFRTTEHPRIWKRGFQNEI